MANAAPPHCQIRSALNNLHSLGDDIDRSLATIAMFSQEKDLEAVSSEST